MRSSHHRGGEEAALRALGAQQGRRAQHPHPAHQDGNRCESFSNILGPTQKRLYWVFNYAFKTVTELILVSSLTRDMTQSDTTVPLSQLRARLRRDGLHSLPGVSRRLAAQP